MPIEEVARLVALKLCKTYNWNPETGADNRLSTKNSGDVAFIHQSLQVPILHNVNQDSTVSASTEISTSAISKVEYNQQDNLSDTAKPLATAECDNINKTFVKRKNKAFGRVEQTGTLEEVNRDNNIMNRTFVVRKSNSRSKLKQLTTPDKVLHEINQRFIIRNSSFKVTKESHTLAEVNCDNAKEKSNITEKLFVLPATNTVHPMVDVPSCVSDIPASNCTGKTLPDGSHSDVLNKGEMGNSEEHLGNIEGRFHSVLSEKLAVNHSMDATLSSETIDYRQISNCDSMISTIQDQKASRLAALAHPGLNDINIQNYVTIHESRNTADPLCATNDRSIIATKHVETSIPNAVISNITANEGIQSSISMPSVNSVVVPGITANVAHRSRNDIIAGTGLLHIPHYPVKKEENSPIISSTNVIAPRNHVSDHTLFEENQALIIELDGKLRHLKVSNNSSQSIMHTFGNCSLISPIAIENPKKCLLAVAGNPNAANEEFETTAVVIFPKTGKMMQTEFRSNPSSDIEENTEAKNVPQKQSLIESENNDRAYNVIYKRFIANNQTQSTPSYLENDSKKFQT